MNTQIALKEGSDLISIRFRDDALMMRGAKLIGHDPRQINMYTIVYNGNKILKPKHDIFLSAGSDEPFTPALSYWWSTTRLTMTRRVANFLDAAAFVLSKAELSGSTSAGKLRKICGFVNKYISYDVDFSKRWRVTFDDIVSERKGCCLQYAFLVSAILCEGGYRPKLVSYVPRDGIGHIWIEVNMPNLEGSIETFVVDATGYVFVATSGEIARGAYTRYNYIFREFYDNKDRKYYDIY